MTGRKVLSFAGIRNDNGNGNRGNGRGDHHLSNGYGCKVCILGEINGSVSANFNSLGDTEIGKDWQKNTGVTIEFQHPTAGQATEQFNLIIADGDYPDLWHRNWSSSSTYPGGPEKAMADGVILDLTDLINEYCPNLKAFLEANPDVDRQVKTDSGKYYVFQVSRKLMKVVHVWDQCSERIFWIN